MNDNIVVQICRIYHEYQYVVSVRLQLHALAYNLANFLSTLALPEEIKQWSLTTLHQRLVKIGAKIVHHGRSVIFQMAEVAVPRAMFQKTLRCRCRMPLLARPVSSCWSQ
jgi:hypothetical protein